MKAQNAFAVAAAAALIALVGCRDQPDRAPDIEPGFERIGEPEAGTMPLETEGGTIVPGPGAAPGVGMESQIPGATGAPAPGARQESPVDSVIHTSRP